jgi:ketosteroid isomerase-like protein
MKTRDVVEAFWDRMNARDWEGLEELLNPHFVAHFPQSGEDFSRDLYLRLNAEYPGDWKIRVAAIISTDHEVVSRVEVDIDGKLDTAISFFQLQDGRIMRLDEFWPEPFPIPEWRLKWKE